MMNGTEFDELGAGIKKMEESLNDILFERRAMAKDIQQEMKEHDERGQNDE